MRPCGPNKEELHLTVNERNEEKRVPSSYLEILANTPSRMATNWEIREERQVDSLTWGQECNSQAGSTTMQSHIPSQRIYLCHQKLDHVFHTFFNQFVDVGVELFLQEKEREFKET